jgi:nicotinate dehydrogenase subunit B
VTSYAPQVRTLPAPLLKNPHLGRWLRVRSCGIIEVRSGKVELGQGVLTALAQIVADELDVDVDRVRMTPASTDVSPDEGFTAGSLSIQHSGPALRLVCAEARALYLAAAGRRLSVAVDDLTVDDGVISAPGGVTTSYWDLADDALLDRQVTGDHAPKRPSQYRVVGSSVPRLDLPDKLTGTPRFIHDLSFEGMCFGRVVRPPSRGATLSALDTEAALAIDGVITVVRDGDFLGVVAEEEEVAILAAERLRRDANWVQVATMPDEDDLIPFLTSAPADTTVVFDDGDSPAAGVAVRSKTAIYHRPYLAHASMGTSCATALFAEGRPLQVWTHSQGVFALRDELARTIDLGVDEIIVTHVEGSGCYGHNGADDVALDAVLLAAAVPQRPVQVVWSRPDELGWAPFGPAGVVRIAADLDSAGSVLSWRHDVWGSGHVSRPGFNAGPALLAAAHRKGGSPIRTGPEPPLSHGGAGSRNAVPGYDFPRRLAVDHRVLDGPLRTSALRSLGAFLNVFAAESFVDELASDAGRDALEYRLAWLSDPRGRAVLESAAHRSGWSSWTGGDSVGHGIGYARYKNTSAYCAVVAEVEAVDEIRVRKLTIAVDAGLVINPDGVVNQVEGGAIQATSWALKERVRFDRLGVTSDTWASYPILRFSEVPAVEVELLADGGNESLGVGETAQGPTVAAIGNAVFDALGVRVRTLPLTAEQVVAAIDRDADG